MRIGYPLFFQAIGEYDGNSDLAYDLGCGSGILSYFLKDYFKEIIAVEINRKASECAKDNLDAFDNIEVVNSDVLQYEFTKKADLIVCEMLDTALIDEEEVPVFPYAEMPVLSNLSDYETPTGLGFSVSNVGICFE